MVFLFQGAKQFISWGSMSIQIVFLNLISRPKKLNEQQNIIDFLCRAIMQNTFFIDTIFVHVNTCALYYLRKHL